MKLKCDSVDTFKEKIPRAFEFEFDDVCVVRIGENFKAFRNKCPHQGIPLHDGFIKDNWIVCSMHGWLFDMDNGDCGVNPKCRLQTYKTEVKDNHVFIIKES
jgi:toluene monooxygenase system ferredoxin subunit